ncbi:MAG: AAA family ATPase [Gammaproteobacteria bacterium]
MSLSMRKINRWLRTLGLNEYQDLFADNDIDFDILPELTKRDLKELGLSLGQRKKILKAIAQLKKADSTFDKREAERRQLTIMFCDLADSTAMSANMDLEVFRELILAFQTTVTKVIRYYDGFIARYMGDGLLVYFGYPCAHEDAPERATRAGLDIIDAISKLEFPDNLQLQVRIGIATGLVIVGDMIGEGVAEECAAVGNTPNLAARLQSIASRNTVLISDLTHRLIVGQFEMEALGLKSIKGIDFPVPVYRVLKVVKMSRFAASSWKGYAPLVGRNAELKALQGHWQQVTHGTGHAVLIGGEPGIGKSRLVEEMRERLSPDSNVLIRYQCSPYYQNSAFYPVIEQLEVSAGFSPGDDDQLKKQKLKDSLRHLGSHVDQAIALLGPLLSLSNSEFPTPHLAPAQQKKEIIELFLQQLKVAAKLSPIIIIVEDIHWADSATLEVLEAFVTNIQSFAGLLVATHRPDMPNLDWMNPSVYVSKLNLTRLRAGDSKELTKCIAADNSLSAELIEHIIAKTDGIPLFIEEFTRSLLESELIESEQSAYRINGQVVTTAVPNTLQDSLMARLDHLGQAKGIAQRGAAIGRLFHWDLLKAISPESDDKLRDGLEILINSGLVRRKYLNKQEAYEFKHALVRDSAYNSLLTPERFTLHKVVANALLTRFPDIVEKTPEWLAYHLTLSEQYSIAVEFWLQAGNIAANRSAYPEALTHFNKGIELLSKLANTIETARIGAALYNGLGNVMLVTAGIDTPAVRNCFERAQQYSEQAADTQASFSALFGLWVHHLNVPQLQDARRYAQKFNVLAAKQTDSGAQLQAHHVIGSIDLLAGNFSQVIYHTQQTHPLYDIEVHHDHKFIYGGHDPGSCALQNEAFGQCMLGDLARSVTLVSEAVALAEQLQHPFSMVLAYVFAAIIHERLGDIPQMEIHSLKADEISQRYGVKWAPLPALLGQVLANTGEHKESVDCMLQGLSAEKTIGTKFMRYYQILLLAEELIVIGRMEDALHEIDKALIESSAVGVNWCDAELYRLKADVLNKLGASQLDVENYYQLAIHIARSQQSKFYELRAAKNLALHWQSLGKNQQAFELLNPVYKNFKDNCEAIDLKEAENILVNLSNCY